MHEINPDLSPMWQGRIMNPSHTVAVSGGCGRGRGQVPKRGEENLEVADACMHRE